MAVRKNRRKSAGSLKDLFYGKNKYVDKAIYDSRFRLRIAAALGGGWNFIYALFHIVAAIYFHSFWFLTLGIYYLTVCGMRASAFAAIMFHLQIVNVEEDYLLTIFGDEYLEYKRHVNRYFGRR